jgi:hypothetical protein
MKTIPDEAAGLALEGEGSEGLEGAGAGSGSDTPFLLGGILRRAAKSQWHDGQRGISSSTWAAQLGQREIMALDEGPTLVSIGAWRRRGY